MRIGIMPHTRKQAAVELGRDVISYLQRAGAEIWLEEAAAETVGYPELGADMDELGELDVLLILGGDGALLNAARLTAGLGVPILGVNMGHLGFLTELEAKDTFSALDRLLAGRFSVEERMFVDAELYRGGRQIVRYRALNDVVVTRGTFARIIRLSTYVDDQHVVDYMADGIIVATPTGSTAYSLSAGGPIVEPLLECILITPICPHTLAARSVVVRSEALLRLEVEAMHEDVMLTIDGQLGFRLKSADELCIRKSDVSARFVKLMGRNFFQILHSRLRTPQVTGS